jgi:N-glycosylase/DNA lyase
VDVEDVNVFMSWVDYVHSEMEQSAKRMERLKSFASQKHMEEYQKKYYDLMNHLDLTRAQIDQTKLAMNC